MCVRLRKFSAMQCSECKSINYKTWTHIVHTRALAPSLTPLTLKPFKLLTTHVNVAVEKDENKTDKTEPRQKPGRENEIKMYRYKEVAQS